MAWWALNNGKPEIVLITQEVATEWSQMLAAGVDRDKDAVRLETHEDNVATGMLRAVEWARVLCRETGLIYRLNGKHTSTALSKCSTKGRKRVYATVQDYECDTMQDVAALYGTFDSTVSVRKFNDINRMYASIIPELCSLDGKTVDLLVSGLYTYVSTYKCEPEGLENLTLCTRDAPRRAQLLQHFVPFCLWCVDILNSTKARFLRRAPVVAAMFGSYKVDANRATKFWTEVREESGAPATVTTRQLAKWLGVTVIKSKNGGKSKKPREFLFCCISAWNAWQKDRNVSIRYYPDNPMPKPI